MTYTADHYAAPSPSDYEDEPTYTECPDCGNEALTFDKADPSVGIFGDALYCEDCGWAAP